MLPRLQSISNISRVIDTAGSKPVVVAANDLEDYACKYDSKKKLISELIGHQFARIWGLPVLPAAIVNISREHVPENILQARIRLVDFDKPAFGLQYENDALDATNVLLGLKNDSYEIAKFTNRLSLLKIALFDLWLANDDRNQNNYNLLILEHQFIPIDHSNIFDGGRLGDELAQLTEDSSILTSDLALTLLNQKTKVEEEATRLIENFHIFVGNCNEQLPTIIADLPDEWCSDKPLLLYNIQAAVVQNPDWLTDTISSFKELIHKFIR